MTYAYADLSAVRKAAKRRYTERPIEGFGKVCIQSLSEREFTEVERHKYDENGEVDPEKIKEAGARLMIATLVRPDDHERWLGEVNLSELREMDFMIVDRVTDAILDHLRGTTIEGSVKNSLLTGDGDLPSSKPEPSELELTTTSTL